MRRFLTSFVLASLLVTTVPASYAQRAAHKSTKKAAAPVAITKRGVDTIAANQLRDYLTFIASDEMEGRDTPSRGLNTTAKFLAMNLTRWGFKPAGDEGSFFQRIDLRRERADTGQTKVDFSGRTLASGTDFLPLAGTGNVSGQLVFAGNGWFVKSKDIDAYKGIDPAGRIAVIFGTPNMPPRGMSRADLRKPGEKIMDPIDYARSKGVVGLIYVPDDQFIRNWRRRQAVVERGSIAVAKFQPQTTTTPLPSIVITPDTANVIFEGESQTAAAISTATFGSNQGTVPAPFLLSDQKKITMNVANTSETIPTQNVVAVWEGSDPVLKAEYVALGAHYDHVGSGCPPVGADTICNGADDDGSGTTALLGMAEALAKAPVRPKRSVLFVWHCGEEKGLWGSRYFTEFPTVPLKQIVAQLNIDMIGRSKKDGDTNRKNIELTGPDAVYVIGSTMMSTELGALVNNVNNSFLKLTFDTKYDDPKDPHRFFYRSDHYNYARKGIPIIFFFDGEHEDYHGAGDTADKIDYQKMEKITRTVYMTLWEIANRPARLKVDKPLPVQIGVSTD
ncbi:MAG TPA: M20/M25/M40 family metallo-hydrolase [Pyrinomonadaceae bacterium]|nr:M20/M25/M40 family metallo-hydrolase [Pyrinomonadaceae bacterium]